jgi:hypothetical protein
VPSAPTGLFAAAEKPHGIALGWTAPFNGGSPITGYRIYRGTTTTVDTLLASTAPGATSYVDTSGTRGVVYYYRVEALNAIGAGALSNEVSAQMR